MRTCARQCVGFCLFQKQGIAKKRKRAELWLQNTFRVQLELHVLYGCSCGRVDGSAEAAAAAAQAKKEYSSEGVAK